MLYSFFFRGIWGAVLKAWARSDAVHFGRHALAGPMDAFRLMKVLNVHCHIMGLKKKKRRKNVLISQIAFIYFLEKERNIV